MGKIKAIVSDFDGTLVNHEKVLPEVVKEAIKTFVSQGFIFSIATGRAFDGVVKNICTELHLDGFHIVRGGSEIVLAKTNEVVWGKYIDAQVVPEVIAVIAKTNSVFFAAESGDYIFTQDGLSNEEFGKGAQFKSLSELPFNNVPKILVPPLHTESEIIPILELLQEKFKNLHIVKTTSVRGMGLDINDGGAGKHIALLEYLKLTGFTANEVLGVGDSYNDYPLLSAAGTKVAMGNAARELKEIADHVVGTQAENGMLEVIEIALRS